MSKPLDLAGQKFGHLTIIKEVGRRGGHKLWLCKCTCGGETITTSSKLNTGYTKSCGCKDGLSFLERVSNNLFLIDGRWMWKGPEDSKGYPKMKYNGKNIFIHRYIYEKYFGINPGCEFVLHKNDIKNDLTPGNLYIGTAAQNMKDKIINGHARWNNGPHTWMIGKNNCNAKLSENDVKKMRDLHRQGKTYADISKQFNVSNVAARLACIGKTWRHVPRD